MNLLTTKGIVQLYSSPLVKYKKQSVILLSELGYMATTIKKDRDVNNVFFHFYTDTSDARLPKSFFPYFSAVKIILGDFTDSFTSFINHMIKNYNDTPCVVIIYEITNTCVGSFVENKYNYTVFCQFQGVK